MRVVAARALYAFSVCVTQAPAMRTSSSSSSSSPLRRSAAQACTTRLAAGSASIPHPDKVAKGGEDAWFASSEGLGVFDGVGGWASVGVDPGLYSKELARRTQGWMGEFGQGGAVKALEKAVGEVEAIGSSTACVVGLVQGENGGEARLYGVNLGDSGLLLIRDGAIVFATKEQQHYFNCPFQVGSGQGSDMVDTPQMGDVIDVAVYPGDVAVLSSDGILDNLFPHEILATVAEHTPKPASLFPAKSPAPPDAARVAQALADFALDVALDERRQSPFAVNAQDAGHIYRGGKIDDITCVVAVVVPVGDSETETEVVSGAIDVAPKLHEKTMPTSPVTPSSSPSAGGVKSREPMPDTAAVL